MNPRTADNKKICGQAATERWLLFLIEKAMEKSQNSVFLILYNIG